MVTLPLLLGFPNGVLKIVKEDKMNPEVTQAWLRTLENPGGQGVPDMYHTFWQNAGEELKQTYIQQYYADPDLRKFLEDGYLAPEYDFDSLGSLPEGTLGNTFYHHLVDNGLKNYLGTWYKSYQKKVYEEGKITNMPAEIMYMSVRGFQIHDLLHSLTGYKTTPSGELILQAFTLAQNRSPYSSFWMGVVTTNMPYQGPKAICRTMDCIAEGWQRGKQAKNLLPVHWEEMFDEPLEKLQREYNLI
jgi:ubiquinone biosynthesis protein COQ4